MIVILPPQVEKKKPIIQSSKNKFECNDLDLEGEKEVEEEKEEVKEEETKEKKKSEDFMKQLL